VDDWRTPSVLTLGYRQVAVPADVIEHGGRILADAAASPARVLVVGSHARGDAGDSSDLDFLVIERDVTNRAEEMVRLRDALPSLGVPVDVIVVSQEQADKWARVKRRLVRTALDEGRVVAES
jgi:predicted nucleotidyltransferase